MHQVSSIKIETTETIKECENTMAQSFAKPHALKLSRPTSLLSVLLGYASLSRQRRDLQGLSDDLLADIGVSRGEATEEAARPFWDAPAGWKR